MNNTRLRSGKGGPKRRTPLKAKTRLKRSGAPLAKTNRKRKARLFAEHFGSKERVAFVRGLPCAACRARPSTCAHAKARGAGGAAKDILPLCARCHSWQHSVGVQTFERLTGVDLAAEARRVEAAWLLRAGASCKTGRNQTLTEGR